MTRPDAATEALAEGLAWLAGREVYFAEERDGKAEHTTGSYASYMADAALVEEWMRTRGYVIRKARKA